MTHNGYAVIDFETTGFSPAQGHRIIEIGLVHVSPSGAIERTFETLLHPGRDLGPVHIHQIRGHDVADAPTFADVADTLVDLLRGRVLVAHNARFETTFLAAELARLGLSSPVGPDDALCTMRLAATFLPGSGRKLADCCSAYDIELVNAHEALADAHATALLLGAYHNSAAGNTRFWQGWGTASAALDWPESTTAPSSTATPTASWRARRRDGVPLAPTILDRATDRLAQAVDDVAVQQYLGMLDEALADGLLSVHETDALAALARDLRLEDQHREDLHARYFSDLVDAAWADAVLTHDEQREIVTVATLLDIEQTVVEAALADPRAMALADAAAPASGSRTDEPATPPTCASASASAQDEPDDAPEISINASSLVVLTGEMRRPRDAIEADLAALGIPTARAVTKKTTLVVAADVSSLSGKAKKAKQYGIPIASEDDLEAALATTLSAAR